MAAEAGIKRLSASSSASVATEGLQIPLALAPSPLTDRAVVSEYPPISDPQSIVVIACRTYLKPCIAGEPCGLPDTQSDPESLSPSQQDCLGAAPRVI